MTGTVWYWNGIGGWVTPIGVEDDPTYIARDVMLLRSEVASGTVTENCIVSYTTEDNRDPWLARSAAVQ